MARPSSLRRYALAFADVRVFIAVQVWLMALLVAGTVVQKSLGLFAATEKFFNSWIVWWPVSFVPLPGLRLLLLWMALALLVRMLLERNEVKRLGTMLSHAAVLVLLAGGLAATWQMQEGYVILAPGETTQQLYAVPAEENTPVEKWQKTGELPFALKLQAFEPRFYPGTDLAEGYHSEVILNTGEKDVSATIEMNKPLRYRGWAVYQASYIEHPTRGLCSVLAVVQNRWRLLPYMAGFLLALGVALAAWQQWFNRRAVLVLLALLLPLAAQAETFRLQEFSHLPVLEDGRVKPLDSLARNAALEITGDDEPNGQPASAWLAEVMFNPGKTLHQPWVKVREARVAERLGLPERSPALYSVAELLPGLKKYASDKTLAPTNRQVRRLVELMLGEVAILPPAWQAAAGQWTSPVAGYASGLVAPTHMPYLSAWQQAGLAWQNKQVGEWNQSTHELWQTVQRWPSQVVQPWRLKLEVLLNGLKPFGWAMVACVLAALLGYWRKTWEAGFALSIAALGLMLAGLIARMAILARPPVATLYESEIFVATAFLAVGLWLALHWRYLPLLPLVGLAVAAVLGLAHIQATQGETLSLLTAVLNTHFWLMTHVITITLGYALCLLVAGVAHLLLALQAWGKRINLAKDTLLHLLVLLALLFTATGTLLGGVWADQSWGRFWGWDPKENGALLIVLWLTLMLHVRVTRWSNATRFAAGCTLTAPIVALSWLGVNLLNVGLHSYGFTKGLAQGLLLYLLVQGGVIALLVMFNQRQWGRRP